MNALARWHQHFNQPSPLVLATLDLPPGYRGRLAIGQTLPHSEAIISHPRLAGIRLNAAKGWHPDDLRAAIQAAHAAGRCMMVDIVARLRLLHPDGELIRLHAGDVCCVHNAPQPAGSGQLFFNRPVRLEALTSGQVILLRDGRAEGKIMAADAARNTVTIRITATDEPELALSAPPVNLPGCRASSWTLADRDIAHLDIALQENAELLAVSFVSSIEAIAAVIAALTARAHLLRIPEAQLPTLVVKVETQDGLNHLPAILNYLSDAYPRCALEVARGDLALEIDLEQLGVAQERCFALARAHQIPIGVATGLLASMRTHTAPTRAEVSDVHALLRAGASFFVLADETANDARYPSEVIGTLASLVQAAPRPTRLFCLAGASGSGKSTLRDALCRQFPSQVTFLSRITTRVSRADETGEVVTLPRDRLVALARRGRLTALYCANRHVYGLSVDELERLLAEPQVRWIGCLSASAALALRDRGYDVTVIYLTVRNREVLITRLRSRGHADREIAMRLHEYDDADAEWASLCADRVLYTDELTVVESAAAVANILGLSACPVQQ